MKDAEMKKWKKNMSVAAGIANEKQRREEVIKKGYEIGGEYVTKYWGCAQSTFLATVDTLREFGIEILSKDDSEEMFPAFVGLAGGTGNIGIGSCGALVGTGFCVSLAALRCQGVDQKVQEKNINHRWISFDAVYNYTASRFLKEYNGLSCRDVTWSRFGKHWDSWDPHAKAEFGREEKERGCILDTAGYPCTIARAVAWAVEDIVDLLSDPITLQKVEKDHNLV
ncbi:MAG: C_GCAxxG_C_C family protein [Spirochaetes bacterium]|nr:C_GCAxxG_C_C family protein [Spirochaetota bacterium]